MIMITGGAYQGKTEFAKSHFGIADSDIINGGDCPFDRLFSAKCVKDYHLLVKRLLSEEYDPREYTEKLCGENPRLIVIIDEIGCGIIPVEKRERKWREETGRAGCIIASRSSAVIRLNCGIPSAIKGRL